MQHTQTEKSVKTVSEIVTSEISNTKTITHNKYIMFISTGSPEQS